MRGSRHVINASNPATVVVNGADGRVQMDFGTALLDGLRQFAR